MISFGTRSHSESRRRPLDMMGQVFYKGEWMESGQDPLHSPTVFLAEQPPNCELLPHFHRQNQFQLFVEGEGTIGQAPLGPVTVHYAGAYTGYGPIHSGDAWLKYFTIRSTFDTGITWSTDWRGKMIRGPKRHAEAPAGRPWTVEQLATLRDIQRQTVIAADAGLGAELFMMPPNARQPLLPAAGSVGQFIFVLAGAALVDGTTLSLWESAFLPATDGEVVTTAGAQGAQVIALHMPPTAEPYLPQVAAASAE
ncbi:MAG: hypothetical protein JWQ76_4463 [Ramlibacter sp.]|nr:hypothetical protein [Ramlibacter sp.]